MRFECQPWENRWWTPPLRRGASAKARPLRKGKWWWSWRPIRSTWKFPLSKAACLQKIVKQQGEVVGIGDVLAVIGEGAGNGVALSRAICKSG